MFYIHRRERRMGKIQHCLAFGKSLHRHQPFRFFGLFVIHNGEDLYRDVAYGTGETFPSTLATAIDESKNKRTGNSLKRKKSVSLK